VRLLLLLLGKIHEFNSYINTTIIVNKHGKKQSILPDRRFLKIHEFNPYILPYCHGYGPYTVFSRVYARVLSVYITRPWQVIYTTNVQVINTE